MRKIKISLKLVQQFLAMIQNKIVKKSVNPDKDIPDFWLIEKKCCKIWLTAAMQPLGKCKICGEKPK